MFETYSKMRHEISIGEQYEKNMLGTIDFNDPQYKAELEKLKQPQKKGRNLPYYIKFRDALSLAQKFQPKTEDKKTRVELNNPQMPFLDDLRWEIIENLGLEKEREQDKLKIYTTVGSPLDYFHGVDFVIEWDGKIITVDLTLKKEKENKKADVVVSEEIPSPNDKEKEDEYWQRVEEVGKKVAVKFIKEDYHDAR